MIKWNGLEQNRIGTIEWNGIEQNRIGWYGMEWNGIQQNRIYQNRID